MGKAAWIAFVVGVVACAVFGLRVSWGHRAMLVLAVATLWYFPLGTVLDVAVLALLLVG